MKSEESRTKRKHIAVTELKTQNAGKEMRPNMKSLQRWNMLKGRPLVLSILIVSIIVVVFISTLRLIHGYWLWSSEEAREVTLVEETIAAASKLILLPEGEVPLVATIVDVNSLKVEQAFYKDAQNGDRLLLFGESLKAVLYSPDRNIIVNVGPVQVPDADEESFEATQPNLGNEGNADIESVPEGSEADVLEDERGEIPRESLTLEIRNGSGEDGAAQILAEELSVDDAYDVVFVTDAATTTYQATLIIDQTNERSGTSTDILAATLDSTVTYALPSGEATSTADVIIIIGSDE